VYSILLYIAGLYNVPISVYTISTRQIMMTL